MPSINLSHAYLAPRATAGSRGAGTEHIVLAVQMLLLGLRGPIQFRSAQVSSEVWPGAARAETGAHSSTGGKRRSWRTSCFSQSSGMNPRGTVLTERGSPRLTQSWLGLKTRGRSPMWVPDTLSTPHWPSERESMQPSANDHRIAFLSVARTNKRWH